VIARRSSPPAAPPSSTVSILPGAPPVMSVAQTLKAFGGTLGRTKLYELRQRGLIQSTRNEGGTVVILTDSVRSYIANLFRDNSGPD